MSYLPQFRFKYLGLILFFTFCTVYSQQTIRVSNNGSNTANGQSWANAVSIQRAIDIATPGDNLWFKKGTYSFNLN